MAEREATATSQAPVQGEQPDPPLVRAGRVANLVNLESVRFVQFSAHAQASDDDLRTERLIHRAFFTRPKLSVEGRVISVSSTFVFSVSKPTPDENENPATDALATIRATVELKYSVKDETKIDNEDLREFANVNVPFNSWGYWRELVQSALARLGFSSTVTLPLFRIQTANVWMIDNESKPE